MDYKKMLDEVEEIKNKRIEQRDKMLKEKRFKMDPSNFKLDDLSDRMIASVHKILFVSLDSGRNFLLEIIFGINEETIHFPLSERERAFEVVSEKMKEIVFDDILFQGIFEYEEFAREKDRLRLITKGEIAKKFVSVEIENKIFECYKQIFFFQLKHFLGLISTEELVNKCLENALFILKTKETNAYQYVTIGFVDFVLENTNADKTTERKNILRNWYQENNLIFFNGEFGLTPYACKMFFFLLNKEQRKQKLQHLDDFVKRNVFDFKKKDEKNDPTSTSYLIETSERLKNLIQETIELHEEIERGNI